MRYLTTEIENVLRHHKKMVFVAGPRQVGKTTLLKHLLSLRQGSYFNWDIDLHRERILKSKEDFWKASLKDSSASLIGLDEIHKYPRWKRFLKGLYDHHGQAVQILVTGSGRLDIYQRGGDSLFGRYYLFRLHPFTLGEFLDGERPAPKKPDVFFQNLIEADAPSKAEKALETLERFSGFPEPLFKGTDAVLYRFRRSHRELVLREDLRDLSGIREIGLIDALVQMLPAKVGAPLSLNALREDLNVSYGAVKNWIETLARLYYLFEIRPYTANLSRALRHEAKVYLYEGAAIENEGPKFENLVALHLKKLVDVWNDFGYGDFDLHYVRNKEKKEADFLISNDHKPFVLIETKISDDQISSSLRYYSLRLKPPYVLQVVRRLLKEKESRKQGNIMLVSASRFLAQI